MSQKPPEIVGKLFNNAEEREVIDILRDIIGATNKREHATFFTVPPYLRSIQERDIATNWATTMNAHHGYDISDVLSNESDPPDCFAKLGDETISIEVTELVSDVVLRRIAEAKNGIREYSHRERLNDEINSKNRLHAALRGRILDKYQRMSGRDLGIMDVLLIHTDEPHLDERTVYEWLQDFHVENPAAFRSVYLMLSYYARSTTGYPVFQIMGIL